MDKKKRLTGRKKMFYDALVSQLGNISAAVRKLEKNGTMITRDSHYYWVNHDPNYKAWIEELPELKVDFYEQALDKLVHEGTPSAIIFALKTQGKNRGWVERTEVVNSGNVNLVVGMLNDAEKEELLEDLKEVKEIE